MLSKTSKSQKDICYIIPSIEVSKVIKIIGKAREVERYQGLGEM